METLSDKEMEELRKPRHERSSPSRAPIAENGGAAPRPASSQPPSDAPPSPGAGDEGPIRAWFPDAETSDGPRFRPLPIDPTSAALDEIGLTRNISAEDLAQGDDEAAPWVLGAVCVLAIIALVVLFGADVIRPGSFRRRGKREVDAHGPFIWLFAGFVTLYAGVVGAMIAASQPWLTGGDPESPRVIAVTGLGTLVFGGGTALGLVTLLRRGGAKKAGLGFGVLDPFWAAAGALLLAPILMVTSVLGAQLFEWLRDGPPDDFAHETLYAIAESWGTESGWMLLIGPVLAAPVLEEYVFRGFFQSAVLRLTGSAWAAILLVSIVFAAFHIPVLNGQWHALATLFVLSIGLGVAFERCKHIGVPILLHALFNLGNILLAVQGGLG